MNRSSAILLVVSGAICLSQWQASAQSRPKGSEGKSPVQQSISGPAGAINAAIAAGATAIVTLQPVPPKTVPASSYPMGSSIVGQTLTLGSVPARVWLEGQITGWAPQNLKTVQIKVDATDLDGDGGGFLGSHADCGGVPASGAGDLAPALAPCTNNADCRAAVSGLTSSCALGEPSRCVQRAGYYPPGGNVCDWGFQDRCDPRFLASSGPAACSVDTATINVRAGCTMKPDPPGNWATDHAPSYLVTFVLDVPADARGTYTIEFYEVETFMQNGNFPPNHVIPIAAFNPGTVEIPCGSCCTNVGEADATCTEGLVEAECLALPSSSGHVFEPSVSCDDVTCCNCLSNADCNDGNGCTSDICVDGCYCANPPVASWNQATECCDPATGAQGLIPASSSCRTGGCSLGGNLGIPVSQNMPDGQACTSIDPCASAGQCESGICATQQDPGPNCPKVRFISFEPQTGPTRYAYRVRLVSLHHPDPPYNDGPVFDFTSFEGQYRWVGGTPTSYVESSADPTPLYAAFLSCAPFYFDGTSIDLLHVTGAEVVPSSLYEVQWIAEGMDIGVEGNYSPSLSIATSRWGDVVLPFSPPDATTQPNQTDHSELVDKFKSWPDSMSKARALMSGTGATGIPRLDLDVSFAEVAITVDAFKGKSYPYAGPQPCP